MIKNNREQTGMAIGAAIGFTIRVLVIGFNFPWLAVWIAIGALFGVGVAHMITRHNN